MKFLDLIMMILFCWTIMFAFYVLNIPAPFTKAWIQNNTEQSLEWILESK